MAASLALILTALLYLVAVGILIKTSGFAKRTGRGKSALHFRRRPIPLEQGVIGIFNLVIGGIWLVMWAVFLATGLESFIAKLGALLPHVLLQLLTAVSLMVSGIATIVEWARWKSLYLASLFLVVCSTLVSLVFYGPYGHGEPLTMRFLGFWSFGVAGIMTFAFYLLHRLVHSSGSRLAQSDEP